MDRFDRASRVHALGDINDHVIAGLLTQQEDSIPDLDTTVEMVYGFKEGSSVSYNLRRYGRPNYQPLMAFEERSRVAACVELRSGHPPDARSDSPITLPSASCEPIEGLLPKRFSLL